MSRVIFEASIKHELDRLRVFGRRVEGFVTDTLIKLKEPSFPLGNDLDDRQADLHMRRLQEDICYAFARFTPAAADLHLLRTMIIVGSDIVYILACSNRIRFRTQGMGPPSPSLLQLVLLTQRLLAECFGALDQLDLRCAEPNNEITLRLQQVLTNRYETTALFQRTVVDPEWIGPLLTPLQLELHGAITDELEAMADLAANIAETLISYRSQPTRIG